MVVAGSISVLTSECTPTGTSIEVKYKNKEYILVSQKEGVSIIVEKHLYEEHLREKAKNG